MDCFGVVHDEDETAFVARVRDGVSAGPGMAVLVSTCYHRCRSAPKGPWAASDPNPAVTSLPVTLGRASAARRSVQYGR
jgi:hypothetical protein